jgi:hypothetical protein
MSLVIHKKVLFQRIVSPDGKSFAQAYSEAIASGDSESIISQTVMINSFSGSYSSISSTSSSTSKVK